MGELLFIDGFDHYGSPDARLCGHMWNAGEDLWEEGAFLPGRHGGFCIRPGSFSRWEVLDRFGLLKVMPTLPAYSNFLLGFAFRNGFGVSPFLSFPGPRVGLKTDGRIYILNHSGTEVAVTSSPNLIAANTWYYMEVYIRPHPSTGEMKVRIDGVEWLSYSLDTASGSETTISSFGFGGWGEEIDDLYLMGNVSIPTDFKGPMRVITLYPAADTAQKDFTPSIGTDNYAMVDDVLVSPPSVIDDSSTCVSSSTPTHRDLYAFSDLPEGAWNIHAIQVVTSGRKTADGTRNLQNVVMSGATPGLGMDWPLGFGATQMIYDLWVTDPATGSAWIVEGIRDLEAGFQVSL